jgi:hypothetical protein
MAQARASIGTIDYAVFDLDSQQRARLADIVERTPVTLVLKRGVRIMTTLT